MEHTVEYSVGSRRGSVSVKDGEGWGERLADAVAMEARRACIAHLSGLPHGVFSAAPQGRRRGGGRSMRFTGVLVRPLAEQADRDGRFIDPAGVEYVEGRNYPLTVEFDMTRLVGYAAVEPSGDSLVATGWIDGDPEAIVGGKPPQIAIGIAVRSEDIHDGLRGRVVSSCRLNAIGLTGQHSDPGQSPIEEIT